EQFLPVEVYVPGCPPRPDAFLVGLMLPQDALGKEQRPVSWMAGPKQGTPLPKPRLRDQKHSKRNASTALRGPEKLSASSMTLSPINIAQSLYHQFRNSNVTLQQTHDSVPTFWIKKERILKVLGYLKSGVEQPYSMLYDLTAIDERVRTHRPGQPASDFTLVYHLLSFARNQDIRIKVPLCGESPSLPSITSLWPAANWYEREVWDLFGINFEGHPHLRRILLPPTWQGHPLRKDYPA